ncbi:hypothetical protein QYM36_017662 [Artemia franciscana]|uniref:Uncharacterized protein n=1 Tax=Artemia franciscana TaxID=6661 RepID=A0AA88HEW9_ARTSF|nr:hypothetical protein QYM36_017662 [Artemia franciscana]
MLLGLLREFFGNVKKVPGGKDDVKDICDRILVLHQNVIEENSELPQYDKNSDKRLCRNDLQKLTKSFYQAIDKDSKNVAVKKTVPAKNGKIIFELGSESDAEEAISAFKKKVEVTKYKAVQVKKKMPRIIVYDVTDCEDTDSFRTEFLRSNDNVKDMVDHGELMKVVTMLWKDRSRANVELEVSPKPHKSLLLNGNVKLGFLLKRSYADDICMIISSESIGQLEEIAQKVFTKFKEGSAKNKLEFDKNKTEAVLFTNKHKVPKITLKFGGDIIESEVIAATSGVLPIHIIAYELTALRNAHKGRPQNWPMFTPPSFPLAQRSSLHNIFTDEILSELFGPSIFDNKFILNRQLLKANLYEIGYRDFKNSISY